MLNDTYDTCDMYDTFRNPNKNLTAVNKHIWIISCIVYENFVPLQCRNKDGTRRLGQQKFCFRPTKIYCLPSAQNFCLENDKEASQRAAKKYLKYCYKIKKLDQLNGQPDKLQRG